MPWHGLGQFERRLTRSKTKKGHEKAHKALESDESNKSIITKFIVIISNVTVVNLFLDHRFLSIELQFFFSNSLWRQNFTDDVAYASAL